jgi:alanine racemase
MAIIKADAYGHGLVKVAEALDGHVEGVGLSCLAEAEVLRASGYNDRILLLHGAEKTQELPRASELGLDLVVHHMEQLKGLEDVHLDKPVNVWLKIDTGMHRLGINPAQSRDFLTRLSGLSNVGEIRLMTHLADADDINSHYAKTQVQIFDEVVSANGLESSCANSAGVMAHPECHYEWIRPGIMLYGASPFHLGNAISENLRPVMSLTAPLIAINHIRKGETIGYGRTWTCPENMLVGVVAIGYGDGYPRHAPSGTPVMINRQRTDMIGRVSMDLITIDLRNVRGVEIGMPVELWGEHILAQTRLPTPQGRSRMNCSAMSALTSLGNISSPVANIPRHLSCQRPCPFVRAY